MCFETMDTKSKHLKNSCPRNAAKPGAKSRWRPHRVSTGQDEALKPCRATAMKATTIRRYLHRERRRTQLAKLTKILGEIGRKEKMESLFKERPAAAYYHRHSPGAMAPENTTQYLMSNVYEDMKTNNIQAVPVPNETHSHLYVESLSPSSVYSELDSCYESCLAFQQRDFEEAFAFCW